jgi:hypothetical protein
MVVQLPLRADSSAASTTRALAPPPHAPTGSRLRSSIQFRNTQAVGSPASQANKKNPHLTDLHCGNKFSRQRNRHRAVTAEWAGYELFIIIDLPLDGKKGK